MSIFQKTCPECAARNPVSTETCSCGYRFDSAKVNGEKSSLEALVQEERLYFDYLNARVAQAHEAATVARNSANTDPGNHTKAAEALLAEQALLTARGELAEQEARMRAAAARVEKTKTFARPVTPAAETKPSARTQKPAKAGRTATAKPAPKKPVVAKHRGKVPAPVKAPASAPVTVSAPAQIVAKPKPVSIPEPVRQSVKPDQAFRAAQAARAEKVVQAAREPGPQITPATLPTKVAAPTVAAPAPSMASAPAPAVSTAPKVATAEAAKECPHCWGSLPANAQRCRCGYEFSGGPELPGLTLSAADRAMLLSFDFATTAKPR